MWPKPTLRSLNPVGTWPVGAVAAMLAVTPVKFQPLRPAERIGRLDHPIRAVSSIPGSWRNVVVPYGVVIVVTKSAGP